MHSVDIHAASPASSSLGRDRQQLTWLLKSPLLLWSGLWLIAMFLTVLATSSLLRPSGQSPRLTEGSSPPPLTSRPLTTPEVARRDDWEESVAPANARPMPVASPRSGWPLPLWSVLAIAGISASGSLATTLVLRRLANRRRVKRLRPATVRPALPRARAPQLPESAPSLGDRPAIVAATTPVVEPATATRREAEAVSPLPPQRPSLADELDLRKRYSLASLLNNRAER
ncbi:MAG: hypothetical protein HC910_11990 [Spirulinaceae cyanobacterium SM2_1_0]|nr:hypothetical protein [Spirulinaceae cyanobacterium SM2_1_0]